MRPTAITSAGLIMAALLGLVGLTALPAADEPADSSIIVVDANGKEHKLKACKFTTGVRRLAWLAPPLKDDSAGPNKAKPESGPEALEVRDDASLNPPLVSGFLTLVPVDRIRSVVFDDNEVMTVRVAGEKDDATVSGSAKYKGINKVTLEAEVDKGDLGVAEIKFQGGVSKGIKSVRFPGVKPPSEPESGKSATVVTTDAKKTSHKVTDLRAVYKSAAGEQLVPTLYFKKTLKIDLGKIVKVRATGEGKDADGTEWAVTLKEGDEEIFTLLKQVTLDGKPAQLEGFVGRVPVGYKLFPAVTIAEIQFEEAK